MFDRPSEFVTFKSSPHLPGVELYSALLVRHAFAPHAHDGYSLGAIEAGVERFRYRGSEHLAPRGSLVFLNPDALHTGQAEVAEGWTYQMLYIEPETLQAMTGSETFFPAATVHALAARFKGSFKRMWQAPDDLALVSEFTGLIDAILRRHGGRIPAQPVLSGKDASRMQSMQRVLDCIEAHLGDTLHVDTLAAEAGLSNSISCARSARCFTPRRINTCRRGV